MVSVIWLPTPYVVYSAPGDSAWHFVAIVREGAFGDGRNENGESVSSGAYFYRLRVNDFISTQKAFFVK